QVPTGSFATVNEAAFGEKKIDWNTEEGPDHRAVTLCFGAVELANFLGRLPDITAEVLPWSGSFQGTAGVLVTTPGDGIPGELADEDWPGSPQGFSIRTAETAAGPRHVIIGADRQGALYGCYHFLESLGFAWLGPEEYETVIPGHIPAPLPAMHVDSSPSFLTRGFHSVNDRGSEELLLWIARNKCNLWTSKDSRPELCRKLGIRMEGGGHSTFHSYLPPAAYFPEHPDWYAMENGKRTGDLDDVVGYNVCLSNADARRTLALNMVEDLISGENKFTDIIRIWPLDNGTWCDCGPCRELGNPTDHMMLLAHDCREAVKQARREGRLGRDVKIGIPAYHETLVIPSRPLPEGFDHKGIVVTFFTIERCYVHGISDPSCREINRDLIELWREWTANPDCPFKGDMYIGEYYNVSSFTALAIPFMHTMAEDIPYYRETGAGHINYMHIVTQRWGILAACNCQFSSLIWDHTADSDELLETYFAQRYGNLSGEMKQFYRVLEQAMANAKLWKHYAGMERHTLFRTLNKKGSPDDPAVITTTRHFTYSPSYHARDNGPAMTETITLLAEAERMIDDIILQCPDPVIEKRLADDIQRFRFTKHMAEFIYRLMRLRMFENRGMPKLAEKEALALRDSGETLRREDEMTKGQWNASRYRFYDNGLRATWFPVTYEEIMKEYSLQTPETEEPEAEHRLG
ncbi:MAG: DUF4838 domain-containing protein, partial [Spirochaetia bacterium]